MTEVDHHMRVFIAPFDIVKIKIFNTEPRIIYSTDLTSVGKLDRDNTKLAIALTGKPISRYESKDEVWDLEDEERRNVEIVETYVPMYGPDGKVIGSFEVYKDITRNLQLANRVFLRSWGALTITVLGVFTVLMFVIYRAFQTAKTSSVNLAITNDQLQKQIEDRKRLERELLSIIEQERKRTGQELHDSIGQQLTGIAFMMESLGEKLNNKSLSEETSYAEKINTCVGRATEQVRVLAKGLHPIDLDRNGLTSALGELAANTERIFNISCGLKCENSFTIEDSSVAINLYRIAQEAITNAVKHGKTKNVIIRLVIEDSCLKLVVENDGLDFPAGQIQSKGLGLRIMRYRAEIMGGSLDIQKKSDGGTAVTCMLRNKGQVA
jgi:signal transduction histidine kinase